MPAFTAVGAYVAGTVFGLVGTAAVVVGALVATGAAYITSRIINGNPNKGNNSAAGSQGGRIQVPPATNNKIPVVYGNSFINGIITDARLISTDQKINDTMFYCIVLSETCNNVSAAYTVDNVYWNDLRLTFDATNPYKVKDGRKNVDNPDGVTEDFIDTNFISDNKYLVQMRIYAGGSAAANQIFPATGTTPAYTFWADNDGSWDSTHAMKGLVYAIVRVTYNGEKGFTGLPNMTFQLNNSISNPADVWYDYMTSQRYGAGIDSSYIDTTAKTAWANFCDEDISYTNKDGATNQATTRYSINGPIDTSRDVKTNIDIIMQNAGAWLSYDVTTGLWSPIIKKAVSAGEVGLPATYFTASRTGSTLTVTNFPAGRIEAGQLLYNSTGTLIGTISAQLTPSAGETAGQKGRYTTSTSGSITSTTFYTLPAQMLAFDDDNIISGITISSTRLDDLYNEVEAEFYDKHNKDQKAYARNEIDAGDRNPNEPDNQLRLSLDLCNNSMQADILGQLELRQSRDDLVVEFTTNHYGIQTQAGDVVSVYSELYDWAPKYFRVMRVKEQETEDGGLVAQIQALEYNPDVYTVEPITEFSTSANIGIGVYGASPNLPQPPVVVITEIDTNVAIPNFQLQIKIPPTGGPYDEIELYYTEGWDPMSISGSIVPGTGSNGAPVGKGFLTVTAVDYGAINVGDYFTVGSTSFTVTEQLTNNPVSKTFASGGAQFTNTVTLNNTTGLKIGNNLTGTGLPTAGSHITAIAGSQVTLDTAFSVQAAGTYAVFGGLGTYIVDTSDTQTGTTTLYDLPVNDDYVYLKKVTPEGDNPTFTNGQSVTVVITEVPANSQTYRRWFVKARMGIKKRFGTFSTPTTTDKDGNFRYTPSPVGGGSLNDLSDVDITSPNEGQTLYYDATTSKWINNSILEVDDTATFGGIVVGQGITQPMITFPTQADGANAMYGIRGKSTQDDAWFVGSGSTADDEGYLEIATGDNAGLTNNGGQIYVRQYNGATPGTGVPWYGGNGTVVNELTLLDNIGYTSIPKRLGINRTNPSYELDVNGSANIDDNLYVTGSTYLGNDYITDSTNVIGGFSVTNNSVNNLQVLYSNGYVGINDATPSYHLDVNGELRVVNAGYFDSNVRITGDLAVNGGDITTTQTTFNLLNTTATTLNIGSASTATRIGASTGTTTIGYNLNLLGPTLTLNSDDTVFDSDPNIVFADDGVNPAVITWDSGDLQFSFSKPIFTVVDKDIISSGNFVLDRSVAGAYASDNATIRVDRSSGTDATITWNESTDKWSISNSVTVDDNLTAFTLTSTTDLAVNGGDITTIQATASIFNTTALTVNAFGAATTINTGNSTTANNFNGFIALNSLTSRYANTITATGTPTQFPLMDTTRAAMKGIINIKRGSDVHICEVLVVAVDATIALLTVYGEMFNTSKLADFDADVSGGTLRLLVTPTSSTSTVFNYVRDSLS